MFLKDHIEKIQYFYAVAQEGNISRASKKLGLSQPSVTKAVKVLEDVIGADLFIRLPRGMKLTQKGETLYQFGHQFFAQLAQVEQELTKNEDEMDIELKVGTYESLAQYFWPDFLNSLLKKYPRLKIELISQRSHQIEEMVKSSQIDLGLIVNPNRKEDLEYETYDSDQFELFEATKVKPLYTDYISAPLIYMPGSLNPNLDLERDQLVKVLKGFNQKQIYKTSSLETAKALALKGLGIALLPSNVASIEVASKKLKKVLYGNFPKQGICKHKIEFVYSRYRSDSQAIKNIIELALH
jgi:molybdate transport repressor ModE-like protein